MQNNLEIVDHEIEDDADIGAAIRVRREPMGFDETRIGQAFFQRAQDGIETLHVPDLKDQAARGRQFRQLARVRGVVGDRFFHEQMLAVGQEFPADLEMSIRRRGNGCGVDQLRKFFERGRGLHAEFRGPLCGDPAVRVVDGRELRAREPGIKPRMVFPDVAHPDHANPRRFHVSFSRNH